VAERDPGADEGASEDGAADVTTAGTADGPDDDGDGSALETRWRDLGDFIREQRQVGRLSLRRLSEMAGVSNPYLSQIERGLRKPSADILRQIARALSISSEELYVRAGILEERPSEVDLIVEIRRAGDITEDQKKTLIHIYESFRSENRSAASDNGADASGD
jgi:transcriptional regulator with XRE-family HTH domain